jgi:hypothetical protein
MLKIFQIFIFDFLSESLLISTSLLSFTSILLFDCFNHIIQLLQMIMMCFLHFITLSCVFLLKNRYISFEFLHQTMDAWMLDLNIEKITSDKVSIWMRWFLMAIWYCTLASSRFLSSIWMKASFESSSRWLFWE